MLTIDGPTAELLRMPAVSARRGLQEVLSLKVLSIYPRRGHDFGLCSETLGGIDATRGLGTTFKIGDVT